jgi:hypothetical protein
VTLARRANQVQKWVHEVDKRVHHPSQVALSPSLPLIAVIRIVGFVIDDVVVAIDAVVLSFASLL